MSAGPTLLVDGDPSMWLPGRVDDHHTPTERNTVRIDGPLPTVYLSDKQGPTRPLRVGDRVTLAHQHGLPGSVYGGPPSGTIKFASATVAKIHGPVVGRNVQDAQRHYVTVTSVESL